MNDRACVHEAVLPEHYTRSHNRTSTNKRARSNVNTAKQRRIGSNGDVVANHTVVLDHHPRVNQHPDTKLRPRPDVDTVVKHPRHRRLQFVGAEVLIINPTHTGTNNPAQSNFRTPAFPPTHPRGIVADTSVD